MVGGGDFAVNRDTLFVKMIIGVLRPQLEGFVAGCLAVSFVGGSAVLGADSDSQSLRKLTRVGARARVRQPQTRIVALIPFYLIGTYHQN